jgi:hypothetical protein
VVRNRYWRAADAQVALDEWVRSGLELCERRPRTAEL